MLKLGLDASTTDFYVYSLKDPITNIPFYVGKGRLGRMYVHEKLVRNNKIPNGNRELFDKIKSILLHSNIIYEKIYENLNNSDALKQERIHIQRFGRRDINTGILLNKSDGGKGSGNLSIETRRKIQQANIGKTASIETRKKLSNYAINRPKEHSDKISAKCRGRAVSIETKHKISVAKKKYYTIGDNRALAAARIRNITSKSEVKEKISNSLKRYYKENPERVNTIKNLKKEYHRRLRELSDLKPYTFINPHGDVITVVNLRIFCKQHSLSYSSMLRIYRKERKLHKGYQRYENIGD